MQFCLERVTDPDIEPVTLAEMKLHLRAYGSDTSEDALISSLITSAREWVEQYTGRALIDQSWRLTRRMQYLTRGDVVGGFNFGPGYGNFPGFYYWHMDFRRNGNQISLRKSPVLAIQSFVTVDADGAETDVDPTTYQLREAHSKSPRVVALSGAIWGLGDLRITYRAGYADRAASPQQGAEMVPERFKTAMKLYAQALYDRDPANIDVLMTAAANIIKPERTELSLA